MQNRMSHSLDVVDGSLQVLVSDDPLGNNRLRYGSGFEVFKRDSRKPDGLDDLKVSQSDRIYESLNDMLNCSGYMNEEQNCMLGGGAKHNAWACGG